MGTDIKRIWLHHLLQARGEIQQALSASSDPDKSLVWAVAATAFFDIFRLGELLPESAAHFNMDADLAWGDVAADNHIKLHMIQVHQKKSKPNQFGPGVDIILGCIGMPLCPVSDIIILQSGRPILSQLKQSGTVQTPVRNMYRFNPTTTGPFAIQLCRS